MIYRFTLRIGRGMEVERLRQSFRYLSTGRNHFSGALLRTPPK